MELVAHGGSGAAADTPRRSRRTLGLSLGALGVVFGDIGTSPLYALDDSFFGHNPIAPSREHVLGVVSIMFWSMLLIVTVKYVGIMMRADNKGEGGSLSLLALISRRGAMRRWSAGLTMLGIFATALFFGDAIITPAVSVLSAVEGLELIDPGLAALVVPIALAILVALFAIQARGTQKVATVFGPVMLVYFAVIALLGLRMVIAEPTVLLALDPLYGLRFFTDDAGLAFAALGSIVLAVTGAETLYADMGHFGREPIRLAWLAVAFPALTLNYLGQGALLLGGGSHGDNPFYLMASAVWRLPLVVLATIATVIASQAVLTGAFSVVQQAMQFGLLPRLKVQHTSATAQGQIYLPLVNWCLLAAVIVLVLVFRSSANLAAAYGIAVTGTMFITTMMLAVVLTRLWRWPRPVAIGTVAVFGLIDGTYFASNLTKIGEGGWFPLTVAAIAFTILTTWSRGRMLVRERLQSGVMPVPVFAKAVADIHRIRGTAIYLTSTRDGIPAALLHNLKHNQVLHEQVLILTVAIADVPTVAASERVEAIELGGGMRRVVLHYGFIEDPDIPAALEAAAAQLGPYRPLATSFFLSRQTVIATRAGRMARWREKLFALMLRNSATAMEFFKLPPNRVVELGSQIAL